MWIDLCLKHLILCPFHQKPILIFLLCHCLYPVQHIIKFCSQYLQFFRPSHWLHAQLRFSILNPLNRLR